MRLLAALPVPKGNKGPLDKRPGAWYGSFVMISWFRSNSSVNTAKKASKPGIGPFDTAYSRYAKRRRRVNMCPTNKKLTPMELRIGAPTIIITDVVTVGSIYCRGFLLNKFDVHHGTLWKVPQ